MGKGKKMTTNGSNPAWIPKTNVKRAICLFLLISLLCILSDNVTSASPRPRIHLHDNKTSLHKLKKLNSLRRHQASKTASKQSVAEALGCDAGLSRPVFMYMDNICHRCFNLFREIEIYYMCR